ncbi:MAG: DUF4436 family protein [Acidobacteria bacterium]|nr:DUF4436 family protein [Acidobacteriota bacterium]
MSFKLGRGIKPIRVFLLLALTLGLVTAANSFQAQPQSSPAKPSTNGPKDGNYIETIGKILSIDPIKGDVSVRLEFIPHGKFEKEDGTLARSLKLDVNSSNGKSEVSFDKGKKMTPTEVVLNMYDSEVSDYPFDSHKADLIFWFTAKPEKAAEKPADKPKTEGETPAAEPKPEAKPEPKAEDGEDEVDIPFTFDFAPVLAGFKIDTKKSADSDETYMDYQMTIARAPLVKFFSIFVMILMWGVSIAVLLLVLSVVIRGRKVEIAMFSFIATLIFSFVAVRNAQPGVPPVGTYSDYGAFFGAEVILALGLLTILFTWLLRPAAK